MSHCSTEAIDSSRAAAGQKGGDFATKTTTLCVPPTNPQPPRSPLSKHRPRRHLLIVGDQDRLPTGYPPDNLDKSEPIIQHPQRT